MAVGGFGAGHINFICCNLSGDKGTICAARREMGKHPSFISSPLGKLLLILFGGKQAWDDFEASLGEGKVVHQPESTWERITKERSGSVSYCKEVLDVAGV